MANNPAKDPILSQHFKRHEFACKCGCGFDTADVLLIRALEVLALDIKAEYKGKVTVHINSGSRCIEYNEVIQKKADKDYVPYSSNSQHLYGRAADFYVKVDGRRLKAKELYDRLNRLFPDRYGIGLYSNRVHLDTKTGKPRRWKG